MKRSIVTTIVIVILVAFINTQVNAQDKPYTEESVWYVTLVKTKPGMLDPYMRDLQQGWKKINDEAMKEGLILSYKILSGDAANPDDWNLLLLTESKNWAAYDAFNEKD